MAQYFPAPAIASPLNGTGSVVHNPDDGDVQTRLPSICVDYLSHDWTEEDIWSSWRTMTRTKNEVANGVRLENASWRTWWKQRNKLKTISPETLNWLKDSDVTWLYGPLHTNVEAVPPPRISTTEDHLDLSSGKRAKPILKHRTISEILTGPNNERAQMGGSASPILESLYPEDEDEESSDTEGKSRPGLHQTRSDTNILRRSTGRRGNSPPRFQLPSMNVSYAAATNPAGGAGSALTPFPGGGATPSDSGDQGGKEGKDGSKRHISFNTFVEQCISLSEPTSVPPDRQDSSSSEDGGIDSSDEDEHLEMRSTGSSSSSYAVRPSTSRQSSTEHFTIAHIAPALLKNNEVLPAPAPAVIYVPNAGSAAANNRDAGTQRKEGAASFQARAEGDFPSPIDAAQWDEDDDEYDYFRGGQQGGSSSGPGRSSHGGRVGSVGHYEGKSTSQTSSANSSGTSTPTIRRGASVGSTTPPAYASVPSVQDKVGNSEVKIIRDSSSPTSATNNSGSSSKESSTLSATPPSPNVSAGRSILRNKAGSSGGSGKSSSGDKSGSYFPSSTSTASSSGTATPEISRDEGIGAGGVFQPVSGPGNVPTAAPAATSANASSTATSSPSASTGGDDRSASLPDAAPTRGRSVVRNSSAASLHDRPASRGTSSSGIPGSPISSTGGWPTSAPGGVTSPTGGAHPSTTPATKASNSSAGAGARGAKPPSINTQPATGNAGAQEPSSCEEDEDNGISPQSPSGNNGMRIDDYWATHTQDSVQKETNDPKKHVPTAGPKDGQGGGEGVSHVEQEGKKGNMSIPGSGMVGDHLQKGDVGDVPKDEVATRKDENKSNKEREESNTTEKQVDDNDDDDDERTKSSEAEVDEDDDEEEGYKFMASTNPTPTSSPTIQMRPLPRSGQSTSASSLPHANSAPKKPSPSSSSSAAPTLANVSSSSSSPSISKGSGPSIDQLNSAFSAQNIASGSFSPGSSSATGQGLGLGLGQSKKQDGQTTSPSGGGVVATARDLLGVLWGMGGGSENSGGKKP